VKYAILSDIHANFQALEAVLSRLHEDSVDACICLGDVVGYGAQPNECCEVIRAMNPECIRGNHEHAATIEGADRWFTPIAAACIRWTRHELSINNLEYIASLEPFKTVDNAVLCHGSLFDPDHYTTNPQDALESFNEVDASLVFFGHTHYAEWFIFENNYRLPVQHPATYGAVITLEPDCRYMINPGSVGQPRDGNSQAAYAIWDTDAKQVTLHRVSYNIKAAQEAIINAGLPHKMANRLMMGV